MLPSYYEKWNYGMTVNADTIVLGSTTEEDGDFRLSCVWSCVQLERKNRRLNHYFGPMRKWSTYGFNRTSNLYTKISYRYVMSLYIIFNTVTEWWIRDIFCGRFHQKIQKTKTLPYIVRRWIRTTDIKRQEKKGCTHKGCQIFDKVLSHSSVSLESLQLAINTDISQTSSSRVLFMCKITKKCEFSVHKVKAPTT